MRLLIIAAFVILTASGVFAQAWTPWQVPTPRQRLDVTGKGETVTFTQVDLVAGMTYSVHAEDRVQVGDGGTADARYYIKIIPVAPNIVPVGLKIKYDVAAEDWFNSAVAPVQQGGYQSSHVYDALVTSRGVPLTFRFFDREDAPSSNGYYDDNSGKITIEVSRETPGLAVKYDTVDFGNVLVGRSKTLLDSIQGYGKGYQLENVNLTGAATQFSVVSERTVPFGIKDATNEFQFTFSPTASGVQVAHFHLISSSAFGTDKDRIIVLIGNGARSDVSVMTDTLDFGTIAVGATKTLSASFQNRGDIDATMQSITVTPAVQPFTASGLPIPVVAASVASMPVTFSPTALGLYFAAIDVLLDDGSSVRFYAKGAAGQGRPFFTSDTLHFDTVIIGLSRVLVSTFINKEDAPGTGGPLSVTHSTNSNPEFSVIGNPGPFTKSANSGEVYTVTFAPTTHLPNYGLHSGEFTLFFTDQGPKTLYFFGYDHLALDAHLKIDSFYYVVAGDEVVVRQLLTSDLSGTLSPVRQLSQSITYDPTYFDLLDVQKGTIIGGQEWTLNTNLVAARANVTISSPTARFQAGGELLKLRFRAKPDAPLGAFTYLPQIGLDFGGFIEPLATSSQGKITISDLCSPVHVIAGGTPGTYIEQNSPNPFTTRTRIKFSVGESAESQHTSLHIYDATGRVVKTLVDDVKAAGYYMVNFDGSGLAPGVYTCLFRSGGQSMTRMMIISK